MITIEVYKTKCKHPTILIMRGSCGYRLSGIELLGTEPLISSCVIDERGANELRKMLDTEFPREPVKG